MLAFLEYLCYTNQAVIHGCIVAARPRRHKSNSPGEVITMGKFCEVCEKGLMTGHNVSHSNRKSSRTWAPNVQKVRVMVAGRPVRLNVCTRCLRSGYVQRALPTQQSEGVTEEA